MRGYSGTRYSVIWYVNDRTNFLRKRSMSTKDFNRSFGVTKKKAMRTMVAVFGTTKDFTIDLGYLRPRYHVRYIKLKNVYTGIYLRFSTTFSLRRSALERLPEFV